MSKYKRNDPCYCGSGKKYKKCCGSHQAKAIDIHAVNDNLLQLHQKLVTAISTKYYSGMEKQAMKYAEEASMDAETIEIYKTGLFPWMIAHSTYLPKQQSVLDHFINEENLSVVLKKHAHTWKNQVPSVYEVKKIDAPQTNFVTVTDILLNKTYYVPYRDKNEFIEGSLLIGSLLPFGNFHNFLYTVIKLYNRDKADYLELLAQYNKMPGGLKVHFPAFFSKALTAGMDQFDFDNVAYEEVAQLFVDHMIEKNAADQSISEGIVLWKNYCEMVEPVIKKREVYASALDYYVHKQMMDDASVTQNDIAKEYDVSPSTVSKTYIKLQDYVNENKN